MMASGMMNSSDREARLFQVGWYRVRPRLEDGCLVVEKGELLDDLFGFFLIMLKAAYSSERATALRVDR